MTHAADPGYETAPPVLTERRGRLGLITLNRPKALNALTHEMVVMIVAALEKWRDDSRVETVAMVGSGDRGLCAGGDIVALYRDATKGDGTASARFWAEEYAMNALIASYPKPYVAIQDGIVLGGGVGVSAHGSHRIVTERSKLGFPEVGIGYIPDVGASWLLSRAPGQLGTRLALAGESVRAADAILVGLADTFVSAGRIPELLTALADTNADEAIGAFAGEPGPGMLDRDRGLMDAAFATNSVLGIIWALRAAGDAGVEGASVLADTIDTRSPTALAVTLESLRRARGYGDLESALNVEYRVSVHALTQPDFAEGIRAQVIDKDRNPRWTPRDHDDVTAEIVDAYFQRPPWGDLGLTATHGAKERT